jgi:hypothetical protein
VITQPTSSIVAPSVPAMSLTATLMIEESITAIITPSSTVSVTRKTGGAAGFMPTAPGVVGVG